MLKRYNERKDEDGFTLIELMVVVLIIGILIAIALPTFLGARSRAQNRAAQSSLRNALVAAKTSYTENSSYVGATSVATGLLAIELSLSYAAVGTASTGPNNISEGAYTTNGTATNDSWAAAALSASGTCYWIDDVTTTGGTVGTAGAPGTHFGSGATCTGTAAQAALAAAFP